MSQEINKKGSLEKKGFKRLNFKKKAKCKNSTFDFTNLNSVVAEKPHVDSSKPIGWTLDVDFITKSKERKKNQKYFIPVTMTNRVKEGKSTRSNSRTKTLSVKKVNFVKDSAQNFSSISKMVSCIYKF